MALDPVKRKGVTGRGTYEGTGWDRPPNHTLMPDTQDVHTSSSVRFLHNGGR